MPLGAKIVEDSVAPSMCRLLTYEIRIPKCLLAEFNTHRMLSRNAASSRAIPVRKVMDQLLHDPYIPQWGKNQAGMQSYTELTPEERHLATQEWLRARDQMLEIADHLAGKDWWWHPERGWIQCENPTLVCETEWITKGTQPYVHKQDVNRLLEPWMYADVVTSATDWMNFFWLRNHHAAHPALQVVAKEMERLYWTHTPTPVHCGGLHAPYTLPEERESCTREELFARSSARCARVSLENQDGVVSPEDDERLHARLNVPDAEDPMSPIHASPFEHVAIAQMQAGYLGNFRGWEQYRKTKVLERAPELLWGFADPTQFYAQNEWNTWFHQRRKAALNGT